MNISQLLEALKNPKIRVSYNESCVTFSKKEIRERMFQ